MLKSKALARVRRETSFGAWALLLSVGVGASLLPSVARAQSPSTTPTEATPAPPAAPPTATEPTLPAGSAAPPPPPIPVEPLPPVSEPPAATTPPPEAVPPAAGPPPEPHHGRRVAPLVFLGVGTASLLVGTVFGLLAVSTKNDVFDNNPTYGEADAVRTQTLVADIGLGLGVILVATGTVFLLTDHPPPPPPSAASGTTPVARLRFDPIVGPHSGGGAFSLRF